MQFRPVFILSVVRFAGFTGPSPNCYSTVASLIPPDANLVLMRNRVLVVEDDAELAELLSFNLKKAGFAIGTASDGVQALKKARSLSPDLILLDVMLPEMDGFAVCEILRRDPRSARVPIVMLTAISSNFGRLTGLAAGANAYLTKPFSAREVIACVRNLLDSTIPDS